MTVNLTVVPEKRFRVSTMLRILYLEVIQLRGTIRIR